MQGTNIQLICQAVALCILFQLGYHQCAATTDEDGNLFYYHQSEYPKDCKEIQSQCSDPAEIKNGVYIIKPEGLPEPIEVYCDQTTDGGGWTVIQRRIDGSIQFNRDMAEFTKGFGFLNQEFWLGNNYTAFLTNQKHYELRIDMLDDINANINVTYTKFRLSDDDSVYKLQLGDHEVVSGTTEAKATDRLPGQNAQTFKIDGCSTTGGWWLNADCVGANLNDDYSDLEWKAGRKLTFVEMKVRPKDQ